MKLNPLLLWLNGNPNDSRGTGGTCFGDSGGPVFLNATIVAVFSFMNDPCQATSGFPRLDTVSARTFLGQFVAFP